MNQFKINNKQKEINEKQIIINDDTKFDLKFSNIWAIVATTIMLVTTFGLVDKRITVIETKLDTLITQQKELTNEFKEWKKQYEGRLGEVEIKVSNLQTLMNR